MLFHLDCSLTARSILHHALNLSMKTPPQVNLRLALTLHFHTVWHYAAIYGSIGVWLGFVMIYCALPLGLLGTLAHQANIYWTIYMLLSWPAAWLCIPLGASLPPNPQLVRMQPCLQHATVRRKSSYKGPCHCGPTAVAAADLAEGVLCSTNLPQLTTPFRTRSQMASDSSMFSLFRSVDQLPCTCVNWRPASQINCSPRCRRGYVPAAQRGGQRRAPHAVAPRLPDHPGTARALHCSLYLSSTMCHNARLIQQWNRFPRTFPCA